MITSTAPTASFAQDLSCRKLILVDIENVIGGACLKRDEADWARWLISNVVEINPLDHVVLGTSHVGLVDVGDAWPHVRYVAQSGKDGADLALLEVLNEDIADRFGEIVLVSGDHIFANTIARLRAQGVHCTVVSHREHLSRQLQLTASEVRFLTVAPAPQDATTNTERMAA